MKKKKYVLRGIDRRSNPLYRQEGTAYDARNCLLDGSGRLTKFPDFDTNVIPRGTLGETGDFLDKLPYDALIIDLMPYEDHIVLATKMTWNNGSDDIPINKFYKWFQSTNTVEFIPFACETTNVSTLGQIAPRVQAAIGGKLEYVNQEDGLYFIGQYPDTTAQDFSYSSIAETNNLTPIFVYDGKVITRSGCPQILRDSQEDIGSLNSTNDEYVRIVPFKIDDNGRWRFGNYSTHFADYSAVGSSLLTKIAISSSNTLADGFGHQVFCKPASNVFLLAADPPASRTINVDIYNNGATGRGESLAVGQYLYGIQSGSTLLPFTPPYTAAYYSLNVFRCTVEAVTLGSPDTVQLGEFKFYNSNGEWVDSISFANDITESPFLSNILMAIYASKEYAYGYEFRGLTSHAYDSSSSISLSFYTTEGTSTLTTIDYGSPLLFITDLFEDMYDQETTKIVPPLVNSLVNYGTALVMTDHENLYFTDLSVGGTIENITPFDAIPVGSSKRGPITGVFATESFVTVFREEETYYISGNIFLGNYRIQSYQSTRIGCTDSRGIAEIGGSGVFPSKRGFYMCSQGGQMSEISDSIEPIFTSNDLDFQLDLTDVKSVVDYNREYVHFLVKSASLDSGWVLFSYNYYLKEWLITDILEATGGFTSIDDSLYYSNGTNVFSEATTAVDAEAYYVSNFETLGEPSIRKKFLQVLLFATSQEESGTITIEDYRDWNYNSDGLSTTESEVVGGTKKLTTRRLNPALSYSCAIKLISPEGNEMLIDGYEYEFGGSTRTYKDEDQ